MDKDGKGGFEGLSSLASELSIIRPDGSQAATLTESSKDCVLPLIDLRKWPSMPAPWSSNDAGETWVWGDFFLIFQTRPPTLFGTVLKAQGSAPDYLGIMTYHYAMSVFYRLDKSPHGPSLRPVMTIALEQMNRQMLNKTLNERMGVSLPDEPHGGEEPLIIGLFRATTRVNYGEYRGEVTPQEVKSKFFSMLASMLPVSGPPKMIGNMADAYGHPETGLPAQTKAASEPIHWWPLKLAITIAGVLWITFIITIVIQRGTNSSSTTSSSTQTYRPSDTTSAPVKQSTSVSPGSAPQYRKPQSGTNNVLSDAEICWCIRESIRIEAMRSIMDTHEGIQEFNRIVDDYNSRCGSYRYRQGSQSRAERDVEPYRSQIVADAITEARRFSSKPRASARPSLLEALTKAGKADRPSSGGSASSVSKTPGRQETLEAQKLLSDLGYNPGPLDGDYGRMTADAVQAFQRDAGITRDGWIDEDLLNALREAKPVHKPPVTSQPAPQTQSSMNSPFNTPSAVTTAIPEGLSLEERTRCDAANRLARLGYNVDWRTSSLGDMLDAENRINTANRLARLGYNVDWRTSSLGDMLDAENRINTASRLVRLGYNVDWRTTSLGDMLDAESRINTANRLKKRGLSYDWRGYSLSQLLSMEQTAK